MEWQEVYGNWVLIPSQPKAIVHFLGGAFVATAPHVTYRHLLEFLADQGYAIVATPFVNTLDHTTIAKRVMRLSNLALEHLQTEILQKGYLPIYGVGHSLGCKLHLLIGSLFPQERAGNVLIAFNNYPARRSIPLVEQFSQFSQFTSQFMSPSALPPQFAAALNVEFTPSPDETNQLIAEQYQVRRNLLVKFTNDDIDQTRSLTEALRQRFPTMTSVKILKGNHLTPLGQEVRWQLGTEFSPLDAIGQLVRQEVHRDIDQLKQTLLMWLEPLSTIPG
jgi:hypothetical protein